MLKRDDIIGLELDFLAFDSNANVAVFSMNGWGVVPTTVLNFLSAPRMADDFLAHVPKSTSPKWSLKRWAFQQYHWDDEVAKGFFVFDYNDEAGTYVSAGKPKVPISLDQLDSKLKEYANLVDLSRISFRKSRKIHLEKLIQCE